MTTFDGTFLPLHLHNQRSKKLLPLRVKCENHTGGAGKYIMYQKTQNTARKPVCGIWGEKARGKKLRMNRRHIEWMNEQKEQLGTVQRKDTHTHIKRDAKGQNWHITNVLGLLELRQEGFHSNLGNGELCLLYCAFFPSCLFLFINSCH